MLVGRSLLALSAFRLSALRYSALPRHITARVLLKKPTRIITTQTRTLMAESSAAPKRVHEEDPEFSAVLEAPSLKRQKSNTNYNTDSVVLDVLMTDVASETSPTSTPEQQRVEGGAAKVEGEAEAGVGVASSSSFKARKSDADRPRRSKKNKEDEWKKKPARNRRRATKEEEEAARERKAKAEAEGTAVVRYPKRQSALLIGFCGSGYSGMQMCVISIAGRCPDSDEGDSQPDGVKTIEGVLFKALVDAGAVSQDNADDPVKVT